MWVQVGLNLQTERLRMKPRLDKYSFTTIGSSWWSSNIYLTVFELNPNIEGVWVLARASRLVSRLRCGYGMQISAKQVGGQLGLWGIKGYGVSEVWVKRVQLYFTVYDNYVQPMSPNKARLRTTTERVISESGRLCSDIFCTDKTWEEVRSFLRGKVRMTIADSIFSLFATIETLLTQ